MLFGKEENWKCILRDAQRIADEKKFQLVYAATTGSISEGIATLDSDYDIRFLFIKDDFPHVLYNPKECCEEDIIYRYFSPKENNSEVRIEHIYDRIAFWELTSFIRLLIEPQIGEETWDCNNLYYVVEHTFLSPYTWDPYGLQQKVIPFIYRLQKKKNVFLHYKDKIDKVKGKEKVYLKEYLDACLYSLAVQWLYKYKSPAPIDFWTLLSVIEDNNIRKQVEFFMNCGIKECNSFYMKSDRNYRTTARNNLLSDRNDLVDSLINTSYVILKDFQDTPCTTIENQKNIEQIEYIIKSMWRNIKERPQVLGITKNLNDDKYM